MGRVEVDPFGPHVPESMRNGYHKSEDREEYEISAIGFGKLLEQHPNMHEMVIDGLLRTGETMNIIAASKRGKSFMAGGLAWSIITGTPWLGHDVTEGKVLIIDNELHYATLANRLHRIATDMMIDYRDHADDLSVVPLRGKSLSINHFGDRLSDIDPGQYKLVIIDALYRSLPPGTNENDNQQMMAVYNELDRLAKLWGVALCVVHHASKGDQSQKATTDVGAGAGSISRACDTHLVIRPHEDEELCVLEADTRSLPPLTPKSIRFKWPLWSLDGADAKLKSPKSGHAERIEKQNKETDDAILEYLKGVKKSSRNAIAEATGYGTDRVQNGLGRLLRTKRISRRQMKAKNQGRKIWFYRVNNGQNDTSPSGTA